MSRYLQSETLRSLLENPNMQLLNQMLPQSTQLKKADNPLAVPLGLAEKKGQDGEPPAKQAKLASIEPTQAFSRQSAALSGNLWEQTLDFDLFSDDLQVDEADLEEFLQANGLVEPVQPVEETINVEPTPGSKLSLSETADDTSLSDVFVGITYGDTSLTGSVAKREKKESPDAKPPDAEPPEVLPGSVKGTIKKIEEKINMCDIMSSSIPGLEDFDPRKKTFSEEDLLPQPIIKKSKRVFIADSDKDDRYWAKRNKNNIAARRSREARRVKENQIAVRTAFLEKENEALKTELAKFAAENEELKAKLAEIKMDKDQL